MRCLALAASLLLLCSISAGSSFCQSGAWIQGLNSSCYINQLEFAQELVLNASTCARELENKELRVCVQYRQLFGVLSGAVQLAEEGGYKLTSYTADELRSASLNVSLELSRDILSYCDAFIVDAESLAELAGAGLIAPLDALIKQVPTLNWFRISRYYRGYSSLHGRKTYGIPMSGVGVATFYRKDLFEKQGIAVPGTWDEVLSLAQSYAVVDLDGTGAVMYPVCMSHAPHCAETILLSMAAPFIQNDGASSGFLIDPGSGQLLFNSSAFQEAFSIWRRLVALGPQQGAGDCRLTNDLFSAGRCLMTVQPMHMFKVYASASVDEVKHNLDVAMPPGSSRVLNRTTGQLEECTPALCPLATYQSQADGSMVLINSAPFMGSGLVATISSRNPRQVQTDLIRFLADTSSTSSLHNAVSNVTFIWPFRSDHWSVAAKPIWDAVYPADAAVAMRAVLRQLYASLNLAPALRLPGQVDVRQLLYNASQRLLSDGDDGSPAAVAAGLQRAAEGLLLGRYGVLANGTPGFLDLYRQQVGYVEESSGEQGKPTPPSRSSGVSRQTVVVIAVVLGLVLLLAAVVAVEVRNKRRHKDLLGRVKPPLGDPDTTIVVASIQDFDELWEALISDASERALQQFIELVDLLLRRHSGYRAASEEEDMVAAFHCPRDACEFALELHRGLLELRWPRHVLEMEQFRPHYLTQTKCASFSQNCNGRRGHVSPLTGPIPNEDEDKLFTLDTNAENVRSFGEQCVASWSPADATSSDAELVFCGIRARVGVCAVGFSRLALEMEPGHRRYTFDGEAVEVAAAAAAAAQGGMVLIPQSTFRQLHLEVLADQCLFCHLGEYQLTSELPPMDLYLALDRQLLGRLALFGPLACHMQWSQGAFAAPVHSASMVFTHVVGVQTLLAWDYDLMQDVIETFTKLAQVELQQAGGYLVEHVEGFMLTAFHSPADAIMWGLRMQELMLKEDWPQELLEHELCEEVTVTVPVRGGEVTSATVFRGPRLKTGIDIGKVLARLHTMTGRMTYRGKVMNRAARISAAASSGQVLCSAEAWESCTASASALRLVTATSLGLFQLKGIQERIEVFHCTYQRHVASSTRRSSTVSVGLVSSSDNRRKSAVVLSSLSHVSHHTTSYRTSQHNSTALEQVSASDGIGYRRGSTASSALPVARGSLGGGQLSDMLQIVGVDPVTTTGGGVTGASPARYRSSMMPIITDSTVVGGGPLTTHTSQTSQRSQPSGGGGTAAASGHSAGCPAAAPGRAALAAVLQSRTRSASAIYSTGSATLVRTRSALTRRIPGAATAAASEPQVTLCGGGGVPLVQRYKATSPSASPSLAMAAAAAAAAACERTQSPKSMPTLGKTATASTAGAGVGGSYHAVDGHSMAGVTIGGGGGGGDASTCVSAAVYAMLPSVVLSNSVSPSPSPATSGYYVAAGVAQEARGGSGGVRSSGLPYSRHPPPATLSDAFASNASGSVAANVSASDVGGSLPRRESQLELAAARASDVSVQDVESNAAPDTSGAADALSRRPVLLAQRQRQRQPSPYPSPSSPPTPHQRHTQPPQRLLAAAMNRALPASPLPVRAADGPHDPHGPLTSSSSLSGRQVDDGGQQVDEGSRVETLEVTLSATGIVRSGLSGVGSSANFAAALGSSQGPYGSRSGSTTTGLSCVGMALAGTSMMALQSGLNGGASGGGGTGGGIIISGGGGVGGGGSILSSSVSSGIGLTYAHTQAVRSQSATGPSSLVLPTCQQGRQAGLSQAAARPHSGSVNSVELILSFPLGAGGGGAASASAASGRGGGSSTTASGMTTTAGAGSAAGSQGCGADLAAARTLDGVMPKPAATAATALAAAAAVAIQDQRSGSCVTTKTRKAAVAVAAALEPSGTPGDGAPAAGAAPEPAAHSPGLVDVPARLVDDGGGAHAVPGSSSTTAAAPALALTSIHSVARYASGTGESCSYGLPDSRSNSSGTAVLGSATTGFTGRREDLGGGTNTSTTTRIGESASASGSGSAGGLRAYQTGSGGTANDATSHGAYTWVNGMSGGSTLSMGFPALGSSMGAGLPMQMSTPRSLRTLLAGVPGAAGDGDTKGSGGAASGQCSSREGGHLAQAGGGEGAAAIALDAAAESSGVACSAARSMGRPMAPVAASCGYGDTDATAMAAAFGVQPPRDAYAAAAAVFGVGPPVDDYGAGSVGTVAGPTARELEMAYKLLGESGHAAGGWR